MVERKSDFIQYMDLRTFVFEKKWEIQDKMHNIQLDLIRKQVWKENLTAKEVLKILEEIREKLDTITKFPPYE